MSQQGDIKLFQTNDGGDVVVTGGVMAMDGGLETAVYLSLFGGNEDDAGGSDRAATWWGNLSENQTSRQYRSETQHLLQAAVASAANLRRIEDAAKRDLAWFVSEGVASGVAVVASIPQLNSVRITVAVTAIGETSEFVFVENWRAN